MNRTCPFKDGNACTNDCALMTNQGCAITVLAAQSANINVKLSSTNGHLNNIQSELYGVKMKISQLN